MTRPTPADLFGWIAAAAWILGTAAVLLVWWFL